MGERPNKQFFTTSRPLCAEAVCAQVPFCCSTCGPLLQYFGKHVYKISGTKKAEAFEGNLLCT